MNNRLYFARIAPTPPDSEEQVNGDGWSWRYKVRIIDKHPEDKSILADEDLPWAQVLLPVTAGSGAANQAVFPMLNTGDTVSIQYFDADEQQPVITGILPRTKQVSRGPDSQSNGYIPSSGFTERKPKTDKVPDDEANESNEDTQPTPKAVDTVAAIGDQTVLANTCTPNEYRTDAISTEIDNLFNQIQKFQNDVAYVETLITGTVDRVHALVNPYVGEMFNNLFESLVPVLNAGLTALYNKVFASVLAATQNPVAARLAAEAVLIALIPPIQALQEAIQLVAAEIVASLLDKVDDLIRDAVDNNNNFTECAGEQFNGAIINAIIDEIDSGISPLLQAVSTILSGGFNIVSTIRSVVDVVRSFAGGLLGLGQGGNKCSGLIKKYGFGFGPTENAGDILDNIFRNANAAKALVNDATNVANQVAGAVDNITQEVQTITELDNIFGNFPFLSGEQLGTSTLDFCSTDVPDVCFSPEVRIFGGRGEGAAGKAIVGNYVRSTDERTITDIQGGVVAVEVLNGGSGYKYPPYVEIKDNCGLGLGAVARSVLGRVGTPQEGQVVAIYINTPGEGYPTDGRTTFTVGRVEVINGGEGFTPGFVNDNFGGEYEVITNENGTVTEVRPINIVQIPDIPTITVPDINPPIPPGGNIIEVEEQNVFVPFVVDSNNNIVGRARRGSGLILRPVLIPLPNAEQILAGEVPLELQDRISQEEVQFIIDCVQS